MCTFSCVLLTERIVKFNFAVMRKGARFVKNLEYPRSSSSRYSRRVRAERSKFSFNRSSSFFCKIEKTPRQPIGEHPKGWSPELEEKLKKRMQAQAKKWHTRESCRTYNCSSWINKNSPSPFCGCGLFFWLTIMQVFPKKGGSACECKIQEQSLEWLVLFYIAMAVNSIIVIIYYFSFFIVFSFLSGYFRHCE